MPHNVAVSVIVPVYNVEKYLERCLTSLEKQTFQFFDIIIIDDGSEDGSSEIAKSFSDRDSRFRYRRIERGGVANARNVGLSFASGEYIAFVDSDDYVEPDYIEKLYLAAKDNNCKISTCNYSLVYESSPHKDKPVRIRKLSSGVYSGDSYVKRIIEDWSVRSYLWNKLWHRSLFFDYNIEFPNMYFEDIATVARLAFNADKVVVVDEPLYHYFVRKNSIMTSVKVEKINDYIYAFAIIRNYIQYHGKLDTYKFSLFRLATIIFFANHYEVFRLHLACHNFREYFRNQILADRLIFYFLGRGFTATKDYPAMPQYVVLPRQFDS